MSTAQKKAVCLYFGVHQPFRLRRYRFFDMGHEHYYYDDFMNESILRKVADHCYLPANRILLDLIKKHHGKFRISFSLTGTVIDQLRLYAPEVLESFRELAQTGCVEFLAETDAHSLAAMFTREKFIKQVTAHRDKMLEFFNYEPTSIRNTELIYSDEIGDWMAEMGYKATITEGAKHILGWKSPNYLYCNAINPRLKVLLRNFSLSDDIAFRFSNKAWSSYPLTAEKYGSWIKDLAPASEIINIFMDYETFGEHQKKETGILDFLRHLPDFIIKKTPFEFMTVSEVADHFQPVSVLHVPSPISWADEERDLTAWMGNELQTAAFNKLYSLADRVRKSGSEQLIRDWNYLQASDHFYYMSTKFFSDGAVHAYFNPYENPYQAFMNYMNVLSDFEICLNRVNPLNDRDELLNRLAAKLEAKESEVNTLQDRIMELEKTVTRKKVVKLPATRSTKAVSEGKEEKKKTVTKKKTAETKEIKKASAVVRKPASARKTTAGKTAAVKPEPDATAQKRTGKKK